MRRPPKPFVTEYKQSNRRNPSPPNEQVAFENERSGPKLFDAHLKEPEDSYEAAMRAADALFSPPSDTRPSNGIRYAETQSVGAHDFEGPNSLPRSAPGSIAADIQPTISTSAPTPEKTGGRILRAIDEPPSPQYAALEAERAPKRRGRKPGSKNRPKVPAISVEVASPANATAETVVPIAAAAAARPAVTQVVAISSAPGVATRSATRFPWVRDRLKPGEDWKRRRLPRVCW